jgi:hypothetical protein
MAQHLEVGACGGASEAVCEITPPPWFEHQCKYYAIGPQAHQAGDITWDRGWLWGAGLTIRRSAWDSLVEKGFQPLLEDRRGTQLSNGGDVELCFALRLAGWRIWYDPRLHFRHFLEAHRLNWSYLCRLNRWMGVGTVRHDPYRVAARADGNTLLGRIRANWYGQVMVSMLRLLWYSPKLFLLRFVSFEGDGAVLYIERQRGRFSALLQSRTEYERNISDIGDKFSKDTAKSDLYDSRKTVTG